MVLIELQLVTIKLVRKFKFSVKDFIWPLPTVNKYTLQPHPMEIIIEKRN